MQKNRSLAVFGKLRNNVRLTSSVAPCQNDSAEETKCHIVGEKPIQQKLQTPKQPLVKRRGGILKPVIINDVSSNPSGNLNNPMVGPVVKLVRKFINNCYRTVSLSAPTDKMMDQYMDLSEERVSFDDQQEQGEGSAWNKDSLPNLILNFFRIVLTISFVFTTSTSALLHMKYFWVSATYLGVLALEIFIIKLNTQRITQGLLLIKKDKLRSVYLRYQMWLDLVIALLVIFDLLDLYTGIFKLVCFAKIPDVLQALHHFELIVCNSSKTRTTLWEIGKNVSLNLVIGHLIALALLAVSQLTENGWVTVHHLDQSPWLQIYSWAFYWATTTMLTIGYGDFAATNSSQALFLSFIELTAIIALAYTLSNIGDLIRQYRFQDQSKNQKLKTIHQFFKEHNLPVSLEMRVRNSINTKAELDKNFRIKEEDAVIQSLPKQLKTTVLVKTNKPNIELLFFFNRLLKKSVNTISASFQRHIYGKNETIIPKKQVLSDLYFLVSGKASTYAVLKKGLFRVAQNNLKKDKGYSILGLYDFVRNSECKTEVKALGDSVVNSINRNALISILQTNSTNYESYCWFRDEAVLDSDDNSLEPCEHCLVGKHDLSICPKFHYIPLKYLVTMKHLIRNDQPLRRTKVKYLRVTQRTKVYVSQPKFNNLISLTEIHQEPLNSDSDSEKSSINDLQSSSKILGERKLLVKFPMSNFSGNPRAAPKNHKNLHRHSMVLQGSKESVEMDTVCCFENYYPKWNVTTMFK